MGRVQYKEPAKKSDTAERMREATKPPVVEKKKKRTKPRSLDEVIALLHKHGIRFDDEE